MMNWRTRPKRPLSSARDNSGKARPGRVRTVVARVSSPAWRSQSPLPPSSRCILSAARARQDVKVVLIGQGPDELFGGYKRHLGVRYGDWWRGLPNGLRSSVGSAVNRLPRNETLKRGVYSLGSGRPVDALPECLFARAGGGHRQTVSRRCSSGTAGATSCVDYWRALRPQMEHTDELGGFQLLEIRSSLPDELLMYADKLSMAHGLEARVPYLDRTIVEYAQRLGASYKIRNGTRKWLHRQVCQSYLPARILKRKKRGFAVNVVDEWFRSLA